MVFERAIIETLNSQIKNDEITELKELSKVFQRLINFIDMLHISVLNDIKNSRKEAINAAVTELSNMVALIEDAKKHSEDLERRAAFFAGVIRKKKVKLPQEVNLTLAEMRSADAVRTELGTIQMKLEEVKKLLGEAQLDSYYKAEEATHAIVSAVEDAKRRIKYVLYVERLLERLEGLPG